MATTAQSIRSFLDSLSQLPGSILYRSDLNWKGLPPGPNGYFLTIGPDGMPAWKQVGGYNPAIMKYSSVPNYFASPITTTGNKFTAFVRLICPPRAGTGGRYIMNIHSGTTATRRLSILIADTSHPSNGRIQAFGFGTTGAILFVGSPPTKVDDLKDHLVHITVDTDTAQGTIALDGVPHPMTVNAGNLHSGDQTMNVGALPLFGGTDFNDRLGMTGYKDEYLPDYEQFPTDPALISYVDTTTWPQWNGIPPVWNPYGDLAANMGSLGNFTKTGTITPATH